MTSSVPLRCGMWLALAVSPSFAAQAGAAASAIVRLAQTGELSCQPTLPYFCANVHVSCSGQSSLRTFAFKLRATSTQGSIDSASDPDGMREQFAHARAEWDAEGAYVILFPRQARGYIKLLADGTYSFRHYSQHGGLMSYGQCG